MQQIKEAWRLPMIDRGDIRQAIDRCSNIWACCRVLVMVSSSAWADSLIAKFKEAGGTVREIGLIRASHRDYLRSGYLHHLVCLSWVLIDTVCRHYLQNSATKMPENWKAGERAAITDMQMRQRDVYPLDAKYTEIR